MRLNVRQKIQLPIIGFIAFLSLFALIYFPYVQKQALEENFGNTVQSLARMTAHSLTTGLNNDDWKSIRTALDFVKSAPSVKFVALVSDGETLAAYPEDFVYSEDLEEVDNLITANYPVSSFIVSGRVYVGASTEQIQKVLHNTRFTTTWVALATLLIGVLFGIWQARLIVRPLRLLQLVAIKVGKGDLNTIATRQTNDEIGDLADEFGKMVLSVRQAQHKVQEANALLQDRNEIISSERSRLEETLNHLKDTQTQLVNAEKMAALGHLIAGIAHEINTPLGAIKASINNIDNALTQTLKQGPDIISSMTRPQRLDLYNLIQDSTRTIPTLSAKEERKIRRGLVEKLTEEKYELADEIAEMLVEMNSYTDLSSYETILRAENVMEILQFASRLSIQHRNAHNITIAVDRAAKIVFALKNYSRHDSSGKKVRVNIGDGVDTVLTLYHNQLKHGIEVQREYEPTPDILCYPDELNQVWTNLVHNAIQAMGEHGTLRVATRNIDNAVLVEITDSGHGIPDEHISKIFDPFFTTKEAGEGTGLGLDIVRQIIDKHEGTIMVCSEPGKTTFTVRLPYEKVV